MGRKPGSKNNVSLKHQDGVVPITPEDPNVGKNLKIKMKDKYYFREFEKDNTKKIKVYCKTTYSHKDRPDKVSSVENRLVGVYKWHQKQWIGIGGLAVAWSISKMAKETGLNELTEI